jgi:hypothetical protein
VDDPFPILRLLTTTGPTEFSFGTLRTTPYGFTHPVRTGLWAEARGEALSLQEAVEVWANWARGLAAILSFAANAPVGNMTAQFGYEITPGAIRREYWSRTLPDISFVPQAKRKLRSALPTSVISAWQIQPVDKQERWFRVFNAYHHALQEWEPGLEIPSLAHLWIGMEALTPLALENHLEKTGFSRERLASAWNVELRALDAETRLRILFDGDEDCYSKARQSRNEHQHGFGQLWAIRDKSMEVRLKTATYLRAAIIRLLDLEPSTANNLQSPPYDLPCHSGIVCNLFGTLNMGGRSDAYDYEPYPHIEWAFNPMQFGTDEEGDAEFGLEFAVMPLFEDGTKLEALNIAIDADQEQELRPSKVVVITPAHSLQLTTNPDVWNTSPEPRPAYRRRFTDLKAHEHPVWRRPRRRRSGESGS